MRENNSKYSVSVRVAKERIIRDPECWEYVKHELVYKYMSDLFPRMIGDGLYHVMKFDFYKNEDFEFDYMQYDLICHHDIAQVQSIKLYETEQAINNYIHTAKLKPACRYCGNTLKLDKRGGCSACGGPGNGEGS